MTKSQAYRFTADCVHRKAESADTPQEKEILVDIERSLQRLAHISEWVSQNDPSKRQCERSTFAFFGLLPTDRP
jgi:hypothetical protein